MLPVFKDQAGAVHANNPGLGFNSATKKLEITTTANQDPLTTLVSLLGVDVWEHAYYRIES